MSAWYQVVRLYLHHDAPRPRVVAGMGKVALQTAQAHCRDPETSSRTCTSAAGKARTRKYGPWFDSYQAR